MSTSQKAEASTEFIFFIGLLLVFFVFFIGISGINVRDIEESTVFRSASNILDTVTNEINAASRIEGYYRVFHIPERLSNGEEYNITIYKSVRMVKIEWDEGKNVMSNIITGNVSNTTVYPGTVKIRNAGGLVIIES